MGLQIPKLDTITVVVGHVGSGRPGLADSVCDGGLRCGGLRNHHPTILKVTVRVKRMHALSPLQHKPYILRRSASISAGHPGACLVHAAGIAARLWDESDLPLPHPRKPRFLCDAR